ncbi:gamma-glutamylcyclotransferase [Nibrella saemangeumensis]|uniref:Gamma-glutamylcyclotransferase n=1 Tax=Nibrella saemangeumensis TaxID=1084526 RepID=A0ABP8M9C3_9BACT
MSDPKESSVTDLLFVYGTLMQRARNPFAEQLHRQSTYLGRVWLPGRLYRVGWFPGAISDPSGTNRVWGEICQLHHPARMLAILDDYEDTADSGSGVGLFVRRLLPLTALRRTLPCWVYLYNGPTDTLELITTGDFNPFL